MVCERWRHQQAHEPHACADGGGLFVPHRGADGQGQRPFPYVQALRHQESGGQELLYTIYSLTFAQTNRLSGLREA